MDEPTDERPPPVPRWVKLAGAAALLVVLAFVAMHLLGRGFQPHAP